MSPAVGGSLTLSAMAAGAEEHVDTEKPGHRGPVAALVLGALGVVYGDIGTSPLYALREAIRPLAVDGLERAEVLGILSLLLWALILIVGLKYVTILLRADNQGEGGVLSLYALVRVALGRRSVPVLCLAVVGAAMFFGDATITPAISVLAAVEGLALVAPDSEELVVPIALGILAALFFAQRQGTGRVSAIFGPVTAIWFTTMGLLGARQIIQDPSILEAFSPSLGIAFLITHGEIAFFVLGAVFLAVTGAEALYADLGHFGRRPISIAWYGLVLPALALNYLGQGVLVLSDPAAIDSPFFRLAPASVLPFLVVLATMATVIAAQAVISGAFSMARAASQLGLLPPLLVRHTSAQQSGQIYVPAVNWALYIIVMGYVLGFQTSENLASAYGVTVSAAMLVDTVLAVLFFRLVWRWSWLPVICLGVLFAGIEGAFVASNLAKVSEGGILPLAMATVLGSLMLIWWRGSQRLIARTDREHIPLEDFARRMQGSSVHVIDGVAIYMSQNPDVVPSALLHNLKHNRVLHSRTVILTVVTARVPRVADEDRIRYEEIDDRFARLVITFGFMESPNVSRALGLARNKGFRFSVMTTTFFLGRRRLMAVRGPWFPRLLNKLFVALTPLSANPGDVFQLPRDRVVELGAQMSI